MKRKSEAVPLIIACIAVFVLFSIIAFLCTTNYSGNYWVGYIAVLVAWLCLLASIAITSVTAKSGTQTMFTSIPLILYSAIHFFVQLMAGTLVMLITSMNAKAAAIVLLVVFFVYLFVLLLTVFYKRRVQNTNDDVSQNRRFIETTQAALSGMLSRCTNSAVKKKLLELVETLEYSDPVSSAATAEYEERINELISTLKHNPNAIGSDVMQMCDEMLYCLEQRNAKCAHAKKH